MKSKINPKNRFVIIMAGGRGERFWPVSREKTPKQLLSLLGKKSFLQEAVDRVLPIVPAKNIFIITNLLQAPEVARQCRRIPKRNIVAEPVGRDTCAAVALGAALVGARSTTGVMAVLPADHVIPDAKDFQRVLGDAFNLAANDRTIVTIGIKPTEPATGYGYIHTGTRLKLPRSVKTTFFNAKKFVEKPNLARAKSYLKNGNYLWNAGMFIWSFETVTLGLEKHQPEIFNYCQGWSNVAHDPATLARKLKKEYPHVKKISIDYALMEHAENVVCADGDFEWDDLGAWTALGRHLENDANGNAAVGELLQIDARRNIVYDGRARNRTPIALVGISDSIIVQTDDVMMVAHKSEAQKIKDLVRKLGEDYKLKKLI